ncbi:MAG: hypothetical protein DRR06_01290 [Gammaproteobacteria bacterium]|nr:MAG: hypothetical protein DRR06_01290 [Gammaproteobacteria bacterium]RLA54263.1 MAG: hypothetical protein DRR42_02235 [Gammaproteobacteria bacterium]
MSLIPEKPLLFYPQLAVALGLEEAVMVQVLKDLIDHGPGEINNGFLWVNVSGERLSDTLAFWTESDIQRITQQLHDQGILLIGGAAFHHNQPFRFAINERLETTSAQTQIHTHEQSNYSPGHQDQPANCQDQPSSHQGQPPGHQSHQGQPQPGKQYKHSNPIPTGWQPDSDLLAQLNQYGIPQTFAFEQVGEFVTYWSERNEPKHSWASKYLKHVLRLWREQQTQQAIQSKEVAVTGNWRPSSEALEILTVQAGINANFVEDAIAEFILYWQERGTTSSTWNSRFIQHVKRQWARFTNTLKSDIEPRPISDDWQPDPAVFDILAMANIDREFADGIVAEFVLYWQDDGQALSSWNTKFLQYAKRQWAYLRNESRSDSSDNKMNTQYETQQRSGRQSGTRYQDIAAELSDRSWAN